MTQRRDKTLFTPGPLTTSPTVKSAMLRDLGSRDTEFISIVRDIRTRLLACAGVVQGAGYEAVLMPGSGTYGVEAVVTTAVPRDGKLLVMVNGAYGARIVKMAQIHGIDHRADTLAEDRAFSAADVSRWLATDKAITHVAVVHCETTTGLMNPIAEIGAAVAQHERSLIVDAMSSFGGMPIDLDAVDADWMISSSNKCIEGVPGFSFVIAKNSALVAADGQARTLALDVVAQWRGLEASGQFRFTPPTHAILAFHQALLELEQEGGVNGRAARYLDNHRVLKEGMHRLGFRSYLPESVQGHIITSFHYPDDPGFRFDDFYARLSQRGHVIYPGKLSQAAVFRVGNIGRIGRPEIEALLAAAGAVLAEMGVKLTPNAGVNR
ncbi:MAG TPA: 2-aminoethylphosphonate--pyruvate transaminase [Planctomycetota bacterium]